MEDTCHKQSEEAHVNESSRSAATEPGEAALESQRRLYERSRGYLGRKFWRRALASKGDVHSAIVKGVPFSSLTFLVSQASTLDEEDIARVLGISTRTLRRQTGTPDKQMPADLASKAWQLAETLAKAEEIFGSKEEAERWMSRPAMGLDRQRPIDLLCTLQGAELVNDFLTRLEFGVYS